MLKISRKEQKTPQAVSETTEGKAFNPSVLPTGFSRGDLYKPMRNGNYSGIGYTHMDGPQSEAERWDMPFVNPVFEYETRNEG